MISSTKHDSSGSATWQAAILMVVGFWLSGSLLLDLVVMPTMYASGMMTQVGFASAGYGIFWIFNRVGLLCVAIAFVGLLSLARQHKAASWAIAAVWLLFGIALLLTYVMTPVMSGLAMPLDLLAESNAVPSSMGQMHSLYWTLELAKLGLSTALLVTVGRALTQGELQPRS